MTVIRVLDFETTGTPSPTEKHAIVEAAFCDLWLDASGQMEVHGPKSMLVNPGRPIPAAAMKVHHIMDEDVAGCPPPDKACMMLMEGAPDFFCAHRADFEQEFFRGGETPWLCSWKVALRIWPDAEEHNLSFLRYHLRLDDRMDRALTLPPHRAGPDAYVCAHLMMAAIETGLDLADAVRWSKGAALLTVVGFGKHRGSKWDDLPTSYLEWVLHQSDLDRDIKANAKLRLKKRGLLT